MGVYKCKITGQAKPRAVKAGSAAAARALMVDANPMTADEIADFTADGGVIEGAGKPQSATTKTDNAEG